MTDRSSPESDERGQVWSGTPAMRVDASSAHRAAMMFGLPIYLLPIAALFAGLHVLIRSSGGDGVPTYPTLAIGLVLLGIALARGATMATEIGDDGIWVRNRWRSVRLRWDEIDSIEVSTAVPYALLGLVNDIIELTGKHAEHHEITDADASDVLAIRRRGHHRRLKAYASLGFTTDQEAVHRLAVALAARGHHLEPTE